MLPVILPLASENIALHVGADPIGPGRNREIYPIADRRQFAVRIKLAAARRRHIIDFLLGLAVGVNLTLDDLDAVEIGADGIVCTSWVLVTAYPEIWPLLA